MGSLKLRHLNLPGIVSYSHAGSIQQRIVSAFLANKADSSLEVPDPVVITAEFNPVYTCGRREIGTVSTEQQEYLRAGGKAEFHEARRGGQTTFHGPGQLIAYPIIDLRRHKLTPRSYVCLLEKTLIANCAAYGIKAMTTEHTGVWTTPESKIAAIGVHLRRNITSHGIGLNVNTNLWFFNRIVACGLEGKKTTTFSEEGVTGKTVEEVGNEFVKEFAGRIGADKITTSTDVESMFP